MGAGKAGAKGWILGLGLVGAMIIGCNATKVAPQAEGVPPPESEPAAPAFEVSNLVGAWSHHRTRSTDDAQLWVRGQQLPPARFRAQMTFEADGACAVYILHPSDAHYFAQGTYGVAGNILELRYTETHAGERVVKARYEVVSIEDHEMQLRPRP